MRAFVLSLAVLLALAGAGHADAEPQGFFDGLRNIFGGRPAPRPARPPPQRRPPPQFQQQQQPGVPAQPAQPVQPTQQFRQPPQQPQQFRQPQQQQFSRPPPQQQQFAPRPQQPQVQQQQQQQFSRPAAPQPPQETFRRPAVNVGRPAAAAAQVINNNPVVTSAPAPACNADLLEGFKGCPGACPNEFDRKGNAFILTYKVDEKKCSNFTQSEAETYCEKQGGRPVSLDDNERSTYFINLAIRDRKRYFWTGGKIDHSALTVTWPSGKQEGYIRGQRFWSPTGGKKPEPEPQPDNRDGNEFCIAVLNNFYADGVKWHDVGCHHRKPTICEFP